MFEMSRKYCDKDGWKRLQANYTPSSSSIEKTTFKAQSLPLFLWHAL